MTEKAVVSDDALALLGSVEEVAQEAIAAENDLGTGGFPVDMRGTCILDSLEVTVAQAKMGKDDKGKEVQLAPACPLVVVHVLGKAPEEVEGKKDSIRQYLRATKNQTLQEASARCLNVAENFGYPRERRQNHKTIRDTLLDIAKWIKEEDRVVDFNKVKNGAYTNLYLNTRVVASKEPQKEPSTRYKGTLVNVVDEVQEGEMVKCTIEFLEGSKKGTTTTVAKDALSS